MKQKKDKTESIVFSNDESTEILFEKIKGWEITSQVEFTVSFNNPKRKELFEKIFEAVTNETVRQNISLLVQRIDDDAAFQVSGYTPSEIEYYQSLFAKDFYTVLHLEKYQSFIDDKIRELHFYCKGLEQDLRTNQYEFLDDRELDKNQFAEAERYKFYLESFIIQLKNPAPKPKTKTDKLNAPVIALFCSVLNDAGIIRKIETESVQIYCKRICDVFKFTYRIRIGKAFYNSDNKANKDKIKNLILPLIDLETSKSVSDYLDNKQPIKQKLFG